MWEREGPGDTSLWKADPEICMHFCVMDRIYGVHGRGGRVERPQDTPPPRALGFINEGRTDLRTLGALAHIYSWSLRTPPLSAGNYL